MARRSTAAATALVLLIPLFANPVTATALLFLMGLTGFAVNPVVTALAVRFAGDAPALASALTASVFNVGIAAASWIMAVGYPSYDAEAPEGPLGRSRLPAPCGSRGRLKRFPGHRRGHPSGGRNRDQIVSGARAVVPEHDCFRAQVCQQHIAHD